MGHSVRMIADEIGYSEEHVRLKMKALGIPRLSVKAPMERNHFWRGGRTIDKHGYVLVKSPGHPHATSGGYVREHRIVMEKMLGRLLDPSEVVHHRDKNPANNDPSNLELFARNSDHLRAELKGQIPKWSDAGRKKLQDGARARGLKGAAIRWGSRTDAPSSR